MAVKWVNGEAQNVLCVRKMCQEPNCRWDQSHDFQIQDEFHGQKEKAEAKTTTLIPKSKAMERYRDEQAGQQR